jgi:glycine/D-amino acid oxidase-like deaminating enzyme/nitrite reductase/ring-hydroxylating ferredoxin subunit
MNTISLWEDITAREDSYPSLEEEIEADIAIIGAGITGITTALRLMGSGKKVVILESNKVGDGTTGFSTGNLYVAVQPYYEKLRSKFDAKTVKTIADSRKVAIDFIEEIVKQKNIDCFFHRRPWYLYSINHENDSLVENEIKVLREAGHAIEAVSEISLPFEVTRAAKMENQARFNPLRYVRALAKDLHQNGCQIFEQSAVISVEEDESYVLRTQKGKVRAKEIVMATHIPKGIHRTQLMVAPYRSYCVAVELKSSQYPNANFWDTSIPHHATSTHSTTAGDLDLLVVADSHHKTGQALEDNHQKMYERIEAYLKRHYAVANVRYRWSAQHYQSPDGIPYIGYAAKNSKNSYIATGFFADGLVYGTIAGILIADLILKNDNPWAEVYDSTRLDVLHSAQKLIKEGANTLAQYLKDYPHHVDAHHFSEIKTGEGKTIEIQGEKFGAYRDQNDQLHVVSAVCTHMKCIVCWNNAENTWDCPCHGSRFNTDGKIIEGPVLLDLEKRSVQ